MSWLTFSRTCFKRSSRGPRSAPYMHPCPQSESDSMAHNVYPMSIAGKEKFSHQNFSYLCWPNRSELAQLIHTSWLNYISVHKETLPVIIIVRKKKIIHACIYLTPTPTHPILDSKVLNIWTKFKPRQKLFYWSWFFSHYMANVPKCRM